MATRDPAKRRQQQAKAQARARARAREWLKAYLESHPCVDCGQADIRVLEFDHRNPSEKLANVGRMAKDGVGIPMLMREVAKCDVRCANCHRVRTIIEGHCSVRRAPNVTVDDSGG